MRSFRFILVDDDPDCNKLSKLYIQHTFPKVEIVVFTDPNEVLNYIGSEFNKGVEVSAILLLDINMPEMTGWEFLDRFDELSLEIKRQFTIYIQSSSVDSRDIERAKENNHITAYLEKPLEISMIKKIYNEEY